jgi:4-amino-4-deoxy-L-arabinose transferase-like glycosyltransferase
MGYEISWLLPLAVFVIMFGVYLMVRRRLSRGEQAALVLWGGWLVVTALVFSHMSGVVHPYYTVALAPAVGALVGLGGVWAWRHRAGWDGRIALSAMIALAAAGSLVLLDRADLGPRWLHWAAALVALAAALGVLLAGAMGWQHTLASAVAAGLVASSAGTTAYAIATVATPHHGSIPSAVRAAGADGMGGAPGGDHANTALAELLARTSTKWSAATTGSQSASSLEIASGTSVMAIGGWSGDPAPTLPQFIDYVHSRQISYYVEGGHGGRGGVGAPGSSSAQQIANWIAHNYTATKVGGATVYHLT